MKKYIVYTFIIFGLFGLIGCSNKYYNKTEKSKNILCDNSFKPLIKNLVEDYNLNNNKKLKVKFESQGLDKNQCKDVGLFIGYNDLKIKKLKKEVIAYDGLEFIVNKESTINNLTLDQIKRIYNKTINTDNLKDIKPIMYNSNLNIQEVFNKEIIKSPIESNISKSINYVDDISSCIAKVESSINSLGYIPHMWIMDNVKKLKLNGVECKNGSLKTNFYPIKVPINIQYINDNEDIQDFIAYIKSEEGKKIIKKYAIEP